MKLEDLTVALRPRKPWEAVDLGCALTRRDYGRIMLLWMITVVPLWILLAFVLWDYPFWFTLVVWWLKPLYDRVPLFQLSRAAFGARPTIKETLREWPRLWSRFLLPMLLWRRLSLMRSFVLPVLMLEGQKGKAVRQRVSALATDGGSSGASVTWVFVKLEIALWVGLSALASSIGPMEGLPDFSAMLADPENYFQNSTAQQWFTNLLYVIAVSVIEPFYVGAGFGLYLNSRTKLEGWDIELTFRRLAARLRPAAVALLTLLLLPLSGSAVEKNTGPTGEKKQTLEEVSEAKKTVQEILSREEFKEHTRTSKTWVSDAEVSPSSKNPLDGVIARLLEMLGYALLVVLLVLLIRWLVQHKYLFARGPQSVRGKKEPPAPRVVMGLDIARESLPDDIVAAARAAWGAGHFREALSLLYRGALSRLVEHRRLPIRDSDTEDDCLLKAAEVSDVTVTSFFRQLTLLWVRAAYAGVEARPEEFESLCRTWPFNGAPAGPKARRVFTQVALAGLAAFSLAGCEGHWEDVSIPLGYKGKARLNPFLAAQYLLEEGGCMAERLPLIKELPDADGGVVVVSAESGMSEARARQLLAWAQDGGHLIYTLAGCAPYSDWSLFSSGSTYGYVGNEDRPDPVLKAVNVEIVGLKSWKEIVFPEMLEKRRKKKGSDKQDASESGEEAPVSPKQETPPPEKKEPAPMSEPTKPRKPRIQEPEDVPSAEQVIRIGKQSYEVELPSIVFLKLGRQLRAGEWMAGDKLEKTPVLHLHHGLGSITVLNHARPLRNRYIDENDHAQWLVDLIGKDATHVQFIVSLEGNFWSLLWKRAWMPLIGLALLTLIWLWMHLLRFGPMRQAVLHDTKHFFEHISALGGFFHRMKRDDVLLMAAADAVRARVTRLYPHLVHHGDGAIIEILTQRSSLPAERIRAAFEAIEKPVTRHFVHHIQDLQRLRRELS